MIKTQGLPIIRTKIMIPALRRRIVHRLQLIDRIEKGLEQGFVLVSAPPGFGKTTLVADWANGKSKQVIWLSLDPSDNDLNVINRYLTALLENRFPSIQPLLADYIPDGNPEHVFNALLITLINACSDPENEIFIVLDDYHLIQNKQMHDSLSFVLEHMPPYLHLILITRKDPPIPLARLRANNQICELHAQDLIFSRLEAVEFLTQTMQLRLNDLQVGQLLRRTEGWITGLQLAALSQNSSEPEKTEISGEINQDLLQNYIIEEVFNRQTPEVKDFLLRTSVLENLSAPLCGALLEGNENPRQILDYLDHSNLFITSLDNEGKWYRYHPLFAETLRRLMNEQHPELIGSLHARAAEWCDQNGLYEEALIHSIASEENDRILALLQKYALLTIQKGDVLDLLRWIKKVPTGLIESSPLLCMVYSWELILSLEQEASLQWVEKADLLMKESNFTGLDKDYETEIRGCILALRSILAASSGNGELSIELSRQALDLLPPENSFAHSFALLDKGMTLSLTGNLSEAVQALQEAIRVSQSAGNWMVMMIARSDLGDTLINRGDLSLALTSFKRSLDFAVQPKGLGYGFEGLLYIEIGEIYLMRNQINEAYESLRKGIALSKSWLPMLYELDAHLHLAHLLQCQGNFQSANEEFQIARMIADKSESNLDDTMIELQEIHYAIQRGELDPALAWAQKNHLLDQSISVYTRNLPYSIAASVYLLLARLLMHLGIREKNPDYFIRSITLLHELLPRFEEMEYGQSIIETWLLLALLYQETGDTNQMISAVQRALALAEPEKIRQIFLDEGLSCSRLLTRYLAYQKKNKLTASLPTREFVTDLLFRLTGNEVSEDTDRNDEQISTAASYELLTPREIDVLKLAASGRSNQEIALELHLSINTVKRHLNNIFMKLGASTRTQAIALAHQQGLLH
jgi:LuxR family maltose regulon positive regulatory protein